MFFPKNIFLENTTDQIQKPLIKNLQRSWKLHKFKFTHKILR